MYLDENGGMSPQDLRGHYNLTGPANGRYNHTESDLTGMSQYDAAEWRKLWATVEFPHAVPDDARFYFRRVCDRDDFAATFRAAGAKVEVGP